MGKEPALVKWFCIKMFELKLKLLKLYKWNPYHCPSNSDFFQSYLCLRHVDTTKVYCRDALVFAVYTFHAQEIAGQVIHKATCKL